MDTTTMKLLCATAVSLVLLTQGWGAFAAASNDASQKVVVTRSGAQPSRRAPAEYFTGSVRIDPLFETKDPSNTSGAYVTFEPGARSAWHTHPLGQTLIVTAGTGRVQRWGDPAEEIRAGDVVWIPPGQKHWHGAAPKSSMTHMAIQGSIGGKNVDWMEKVNEEQYRMADTQKSDAIASALTLDDVRSVAPALERYTQGALADLWKRPGLAARDRSLITISVVIARSQTTELASHLDRALDDGVRPNVFSAVTAAKDVFDKRPH
jgi:4-carboxymuconolactone decarboxylase